MKGILFDFNGVIIDDEPIQMRAYQELLSAEDIDLTDADYAASHGMDDRTFVRAAYERAGKSVETAKVEEIISGKFAKWNEIVGDNIPLFDGVEGFVAKMSREFTLGIVSMEKGDQIRRVLGACGLAGYFSVIVSAEDVTRCKPDPECYRTGFRKLDAVRTASGRKPLTHNECLVIEDTVPGVRAARAADLPVLGVANTIGAEPLRSAGAAAVTGDLSDWMPESIRRIFG